MTNEHAAWLRNEKRRIAQFELCGQIRVFGGLVLLFGTLALVLFK